jgi:HK97 family phage prohead protease
VITPGAFKKSLATHKTAKTKPVLLWQHDSRQPIGVWDDMKEDEKGLLATGNLLVHDVYRAKEAYALLKAGAISGLSIGYYARDYSRDQKTGIRTLKEVEILEASLVTFPANEDARVTGVKTADIKTIRDFEAFLRDVGGFSANEAKCIASRGFKAREAPGLDQEASTVLESIAQKYM